MHREVKSEKKYTNFTKSLYAQNLIPEQANKRKKSYRNKIQH